MAIVTRESLQEMIDNEINEDGSYTPKLQHIIGRALVALFERQTAGEQSYNQTEEHNTIGFSGADGRSGSLTAKSYLKHRALLEWQIERWVKNSGNTSFSRITKYHRQLNEIATAKLTAKVEAMEQMKEAA